MGMVVAVRPHIPIVGTVQAVTPRTKKGTDEVYKFDVTVLTPSGGQTQIEFWERDGQSNPLPDEGRQVVLIAEISPPNGTFAAAFGFVRYAEPGDLDLILSASGLASAKA